MSDPTAPPAPSPTDPDAPVDPDSLPIEADDPLHEVAEPASPIAVPRPEEPIGI